MSYTNFKNLFDYRELIFALASKEIKLKYKSAVLGYAWSVLQPVLLMLIFTFIFTFIIKIEVDKFPVFLLCALLPWFFFSFSLSGSTPSIVENASLIKKAYFPAEVIPVSVVAANLVNFLISMVLLQVFIFFFRIYPTVYTLYLFPLIGLEFFFVLGLCYMVSALHALYRDVKYLVEIILLVWFYATPVFYPIEFIPEKYRFIFALNPLSEFVGLFRDIIIRGKPPELNGLISLFFISIIFYFSGSFIFKKYKNVFVDVI